MFPSLYHEHHNLHTEDLPFWLELAAQQRGAVLELGCGTGRVLLPLWEAGISAWGLDNDLEMLRFLRANLPTPLRTKPPLFQADMAAFHLARQFSLILLPCNTWSTLSAEKRQAALTCIHRHLAEGGMFAVSLPNPELLAALPRRGEEEIEETFLHPLTGNPVQVSSAWRRSQQDFTITWHYDQLLPNGEVERFSAQAKHALDAPSVYLAELTLAGLTLEAAFGDFDRTPFSPDESSYLILAASAAR